MNNDEIKKLFEMDSDGRFVRLVIPELDGMPEINLTGKRKTELNSEEVSRMKIYVRELSNE
jgi:hypothetical protein